MGIIENALTIEEAFEMLLLDYLDFETSVFRLNIEGLIRGHSEENSNFFDNRRLLNRAISNFLSSSRAYTDQIEKLDKTYSGLKAKTTSHEFDSTDVYPFVCKLRNYVQHYDVVIHKKRHGSFSLFEDVAGNHEHRPYNSSLQLIIDKERLVSSTIFSDRVLEPMPDEIFITRTFREYLGCLSRIHEAVRVELDYFKYCQKLNHEKDAEHDYRKVDVVLGLIRKNVPNDLIERTKMIGVQ